MTFDPTKHRQTQYPVPSEEVLAVMRQYEWLQAKDIVARLQGKNFSVTPQSLGRQLATIWKNGLKLRRKVEAGKIYWKIR